MTSEEKQILDFLRQSPKAFFSSKEIARKAGTKRQFVEDPHWPKPYLSRLVEQRLLENDDTGHYRFKRIEDKKKFKNKVAMAPHIAAMLKKTGKDFSGVGLEIDLPDEPPPPAKT